MVRASLASGVGILAALLIIAGFSAAQPVATGQAGGEIVGEVSGAYHADATGAVDEAHEHHDALKTEGTSQWHAANDAYETTRADAWATADQAEPEPPQIEGEERIFDELDQTSSVQASHADKIEKAADLETDYVDAGADVSGAAKADAWFNNLFTGLKDAYTGLKGMMALDTSAKEDVKSEAYQALHADDELRGELTQVVETDQQLPEVDPTAEGELGAQHATSVTSQVIGQASAGIP